MSQPQLFATGVLLAWLAGIRVYLTVFGVGLAGALGWLDLPPALQATQSPWVLGVSGGLALVEFLADKIPGAGVALASHALKSSSRMLLNLSPEPLSNWTASTTEDGVVLGGLALAFVHPLLALSIAIALSAALATTAWWLWRMVFRRRPRAR
jgi:hypothetical protein